MDYLGARHICGEFDRLKVPSPPEKNMVEGMQKRVAVWIIAARIPFRRHINRIKV